MVHHVSNKKNVVVIGFNVYNNRSIFFFSQWTITNDSLYYLCNSWGHKNIRYVNSIFFVKRQLNGNVEIWDFIRCLWIYSNKNHKGQKFIGVKDQISFDEWKKKKERSRYLYMRFRTSKVQKGGEINYYKYDENDR